MRTKQHDPTESENAFRLSTAEIEAWLAEERPLQASIAERREARAKAERDEEAAA